MTQKCDDPWSRTGDRAVGLAHSRVECKLRPPRDRSPSSAWTSAVPHPAVPRGGTGAPGDTLRSGHGSAAGKSHPWRRPEGHSGAAQPAEGRESEGVAGCGRMWRLQAPAGPRTHEICLGLPAGWFLASLREWGWGWGVEHCPLASLGLSGTWAHSVAPGSSPLPISGSHTPSPQSPTFSGAADA